MKTSIAHVQFIVDPANYPFYRELLGFLGWPATVSESNVLGVTGPHGETLWFCDEPSGARNDYDGTGMNHFAFGAESRQDVDTLAGYVRERGIQPLFGTPRARPDFASFLPPGEPYYHLMFETPDRLLFELVHIGPGGPSRSAVPSLTRAVVRRQVEEYRSGLLRCSGEHPHRNALGTVGVVRARGDVAAA